MTEYSDIAQWAIETLKVTVAVTDLVIGGIAGIVQSGNLSAADLQAAQRTRQENGESKALAILVMDTGEQGGQRASCTVYVYDRGSNYGYDNIRNAREAVIEALAGKPIPLTRDMTVIKLEFDNRSGHEVFNDFETHYEQINFSAPLEGEYDQYT
jgi:hypothetical protein